MDDEVEGEDSAVGTGFLRQRSGEASLEAEPAQSGAKIFTVPSSHLRARAECAVRSRRAGDEDGRGLMDSAVSESISSKDGRNLSRARRSLEFYLVLSKFMNKFILKILPILVVLLLIFLFFYQRSN